jgi:hypothetical protein
VFNPFKDCIAQQRRKALHSRLFCFSERYWVLDTYEITRGTRMDENQKFQALFFQLIMSFQAAAMQHLGQMENMFSQKIEKDLTQAQLSIDMIEMIRQKTEGNRSDDETQFIDHVLRELRLVFVKEQSATVSEK